MIVELRSIDRYNIEECAALKVTDEQAQYIASNSASLMEARKKEDIARAFAIYADDQMVGFAMFAFDEDYEDPNDRYWLWRFMIDRNFQGKGYGTSALKQIIDYFRSNGANNITLSTKAGNIPALSLYRKLGFRENGDMNGNEIVLKLEL